jgi:hypothetical protein
MSRVASVDGNCAFVNVAILPCDHFVVQRVDADGAPSAARLGVVWKESTRIIHKYVLYI